MAAHNDFGRHAEQQAADLLVRAGWSIIDRNWRFGHLEIDLVARRGRVVAFVEVRARRSCRFGHPLDTIDWRKRRGLEAAARGWIVRHGVHGDEYRFDAISVAGGTGEVQHLEDAWRV